MSRKKMMMFSQRVLKIEYRRFGSSDAGLQKLTFVTDHTSVTSAIEDLITSIVSSDKPNFAKDMDIKTAEITDLISFEYFDFED